MPTSSRSSITPSSPRVRSTSPPPTSPRTDGPIEDAGDDLADDGGDVDPLGDLGRDLGRDQHDQDVEQYGDDVVIHGPIVVRRTTRWPED